MDGRLVYIIPLPVRSYTGRKGGAEEAQDKALLLFVSAMVSQGDDPSFSVWNRKDGNLPQGKVSISDTFLMPGTDFIYVLGEFMRTVSI